MELKGRVWDKEKQKMIYPQDGDLIAWHAPSNWKQWYEIMLQIGMKVDDGTNIHEGDIIRTTSGGQEQNWLVEEVGALERDNSHRGLCVSPDGNGVNYFIDKSILSGKIIGNIFENPNLLDVMDS